jgi:D-alanine--poly(phosphoribitol) ligase subunit 2
MPLIGSPTVDTVAAAVVRFLNTEIMAASHPIATDDRLTDAGVDSMALLKVLVFLEREFGIWVPDEDLTDDVITSARTLAAYVCRFATT